jgi:hypothetical protein
MQPTSKDVGKTDQRTVITGDFPQIRRGRRQNVAKALFPDCRHYQLICHPELAIFYGRAARKFFVAAARISAAARETYSVCFTGLPQTQAEARSHSSVT